MRFTAPENLKRSGNTECQIKPMGFASEKRGWIWWSKQKSDLCRLRDISVAVVRSSVDVAGWVARMHTKPHWRTKYRKNIRQIFVITPRKWRKWKYIKLAEIPPPVPAPVRGGLFPGWQLFWLFPFLRPLFLMRLLQWWIMFWSIGWIGSMTATP